MSNGKYDDIINLPNPTPTCRPRMSTLDRAAQFSPFAALTGYEAVVEEAARLTDARSELSEDMKIMLNDKMQRIVDNLENEPFVTITYFVPDKRKASGRYVTEKVTVKQVVAAEGKITTSDGRSIDMSAIIEVGE